MVLPVEDVGIVEGHLQEEHDEFPCPLGRLASKAVVLLHLVEKVDPTHKLTVIVDDLRTVEMGLFQR